MGFDIAQLAFDSLIQGLWSDDPTDYQEDSDLGQVDTDSSLSRDCLAIALGWTPSFSDD